MESDLRRMSASAALNQYFAELPENDYKDGIKLLEERWLSVLKLRENILNKKTDFIKKYTFFHFRFQIF